MLPPACGGFLRSEAGTLRFPHSNNSNVYPHGVNCGWVIITNSSLVLNVTFTYFDIEGGLLCNYDWLQVRCRCSPAAACGRVPVQSRRAKPSFPLQIHDGPTSGSFQIGRFCGDTPPMRGHIMSTHNALYLWFRADSSIAKRGFELHWNSVQPGGQGAGQDGAGGLAAPCFVIVMYFYLYWGFKVVPVLTK